MANTAKKNETNIGSVQLDKVNREVLVKNAKKLKVGSGKDTTEAIIAALVARFAKLPAERLADCSDCGGESDTELEECPFCGSKNDDEESESASEASESASDDASASSASSDTAAAGWAAGKPVPATTDDASASIDDRPEVLAQQRRALKKTTGVVAGVGLAAAGASPSSALSQYTETDLNEAVDRVIRMKGDAMVSHWRLGAEIKAIYDKQLWKQRNDADNGKPKYKSFNQFVVIELGFLVNNAYWLIDVATHFTEDDVRAYGTTKLGHILSVPKEDRTRLLEAVKAGATVREIREEVKQMTAGVTTERQTGRQKQPRKKGARAKKVKKTAPKAGTMTIARILGKQTVKLFKGPWPRTGEPEVRAKKLGDNPVGVLDFENGVRMYFQITTSPSGELVLRTDTKRDD